MRDVVHFWQTKARSEGFWGPPRTDRPPQWQFESPSFEIRLLTLEQDVRDAERQIDRMATGAGTAGHSLHELQNMVHDWANEQFPGREPSIAWMKLFEELGEVIREPSDRLEWADVIIIILDLAAIYGVTLDAAILEKMAINRRRIWTTSPTGVMVHRRGEEAVTEPTDGPPFNSKHRPPTIAVPGFWMVFEDGPLDSQRHQGMMDPTIPWTPGIDGDETGLYYWRDSDFNAVRDETVQRWRWSAIGIPF